MRFFEAARLAFELPVPPELSAAHEFAADALLAALVEP
jgi:hypothetical protein